MKKKKSPINDQIGSCRNSPIASKQTPSAKTVSNSSIIIYQARLYLCKPEDLQDADNHRRDRNDRQSTPKGNLATRPGRCVGRLHGVDEHVGQHNNANCEHNKPANHGTHNYSPRIVPS